MFKIAEELMTKIADVIASNQPALAEGNMVFMGGCSAGCGATCSSRCDGSCKGSCTASCHRNSR